MKNCPNIIINKLDKELISADFLKIERTKLQFEYPDGSQDEMTVESIQRKRSDAVVIIAYFIEREVPYIYLRSALRPALAVCDYKETDRCEDYKIGNHWELPAGLVEIEEKGFDGLREAASRETEEELGFKIPKEKYKELGNRVFSCPGILGERLYFFITEVNPASRNTPLEDGSPLEKGGIVEIFSLETALLYVDNGLIHDCKTEIGLYRLKRLLDGAKSK